MIDLLNSTTQGIHQGMSGAPSVLEEQIMQQGRKTGLDGGSAEVKIFNCGLCLSLLSMVESAPISGKR